MDQGAAGVILYQAVNGPNRGSASSCPRGSSRPLGFCWMSSRCSSSNRIPMLISQGGATKVSTMTDIGHPG